MPGQFLRPGQNLGPGQFCGQKWGLVVSLHTYTLTSPVRGRNVDESKIVFTFYF